MRKLFFVTRDLKTLRDPWTTQVITDNSWSHHSIFRDFETRVLWMVRIKVRIVYWQWLRHVICNMELWLSTSRVSLQTQTYFRLSVVSRRFSAEPVTAGNTSAFDVRRLFTSLLSSNTLSCVRTGYSKEYLTCLFSWFRKGNFYIRSPWSSIFFRSWTGPETVRPSFWRFNFTGQKRTVWILSSI